MEMRKRKGGHAMTGTEKIDKLARDVLRLSRNTLLVHLRFLDAALSQFELVSQDDVPIMTDGKHLFYNPLHILMSYKNEKEIPVRDYLHIVMHCIFRHMYGASKLKQDFWDLACDIAVEATITELGLKAVSAKRENGQKQIIGHLQKEIGKLTAEKIYRYYLDLNPGDSEISEIHSLFAADNHEIWYWTVTRVNMYIVTVTEKGTGVLIGSQGAESNQDGDSEGSFFEEGKNAGKFGKESNDSSKGEKNQENIWKQISERIQVELDTLFKSRGDVPGNLIQNLNAVNREKYDYTEFLRKFAVRGEVMKINDEEFDYIFYTYGLKLYEKMPLIEPLEYKEVKRIREFVIAIDTSGSVVGEEVQAFVQKTYNVLKSTESFFSKINLHIIQCDADIQEHVKITTQDEFDAWIQTMEIKGLGGTDFRPVFSKVDELIKQHEFFNLKGLIYFTDGYGVFPERKPAYETAFVFVNDEYENPEVPSWAIKLVLQRDEL